MSREQRPITDKSCHRAVTSNLLPTPTPNAKENSFLLKWKGTSLRTSYAASMLVSLLFIFHGWKTCFAELCDSSCKQQQACTVPKAVVTLGGRATEGTSNMLLIREGNRGCRVTVTSKNSFAHCLLTAVIVTSNL